MCWIKGDEMGKRAQAEMKSFLLAEKRRLEVIEQFKNCKSYEEFSKSQKKYEEKKGKNFFIISSKLTEYHIQRLRKLDEEITQLKLDLKKQFPSPSEQVKLQQTQEHLISESLNLDVDNIVVKEIVPNMGLVESGNQGSQQKDAHGTTLSSEKAIQENSLDPRTIREREAHLLQVNVQLRAFKLKQEELEAKYEENRNKGNQAQANKYQKASEAAKSIYSEISRLANQYIIDGNLDAFKNNSQTTLKEDNDNVKILQEHRGWKSFLANLAALIFTAGFAQAGYSIYKGQLSWLKPATDTGKKVENLCTSINAIAVTV